MLLLSRNLTLQVADPEFSRGGCANSQIGIIFKMKEFGPRGGRVPGAPLRSANAYINLLKLTLPQYFPFL